MKPVPEAAVRPDPVPGWRERAVSRSLDAARSRAEERVERFLDAAFALVDEKGTTEFTIQEVVDRSKQSLRSFYEYFDGKDELVLAMFEETVREADADIADAVAAAGADPLAALRAYTVRLYEWCDPADPGARRGHHDRRPISEFAMRLATDHSERVRAALGPLSRLLLDLVDAAADAGVITVADRRRSAALVQQTVLYTWFGNRLVEHPKQRLTAEETWAFCLHGLGAPTGGTGS